MRPESQQLTQLLSDARNEARQLASDAEETQTLILDDKNWVEHALVLSPEAAFAVPPAMAEIETLRSKLVVTGAPTA